MEVIVMDILVAKNIKKSFGQGQMKLDVIKNMSLSFKQGTFNVIVGKSGSGKLTLLNVLSGLESMDSGQVFLEGMDIHSLNDDELSMLRRQKIGFIFQFYNLIPELTVYENITLPIQLDEKIVDEHYIDELLEWLEIKDKKDIMPSLLSGGQQQRVAIARALAIKPVVIFADEPTGNLDEESGKKIVELLKQSQQRYHQTLILVTHDLTLASVAKRIITIKDGTIIQDVTNGKEY